MGFKLDGPGGAVPVLQLNYSPDTPPNLDEDSSLKLRSSGAFPLALAVGPPPCTLTIPAQVTVPRKLGPPTFASAHPARRTVHL